MSPEVRPLPPLQGQGSFNPYKSDGAFATSPGAQYNQLGLAAVADAQATGRWGRGGRCRWPRASTSTQLQEVSSGMIFFTTLATI